MEIYKVIFKDKQSITVQADCVTEAITEAKYVLESQGITPAKVDSVWSLVYMDQFYGKENRDLQDKTQDFDG